MSKGKTTPHQATRTAGSTIHAERVQWRRARITSAATIKRREFHTQIAELERNSATQCSENIALQLTEGVRYAERCVRHRPSGT